MRKTINLLIRIFFIIIVLFLLLGFKNAFGYEQTYNNVNFVIPDEIISQISTLPEYSDDNRYVIIYAKDGFGKYEVCFPFKGFKPYMTTRNFGESCVRFSDEPISLNYYSYNFNTFQYTGYGSANSYYTGEIYVPDGVYYLYCSENIYTDSSYTDIFYNKSNNNDSFTLDILTPVSSLLTGEYSNIVCKFNNKYNVINFTVKTPNEFSGDDTNLMPIVFQVYLDFNNDDFVNQKYYFSYDGFSIIDVPANDCLLKNNTHYYIELFVLDFSTAEHYSMFYDFTTDFSEEGIINIENITNSNPNRGVINSLDKGFNTLEEQNKNIFNKIGDILNLLNPFHENFFGKKLVDLILDGLKSLFIPENEYFSNYFDELNNWFSDRLGFLYYPLDVLFDLLNRFLNISSENLTINIPEIKEPTTDTVLIKNQIFDFNTLLENEVLKNLHNIYLIIVDAIICFGLVNLLYKKYEEVIAK